MYWLGCRKFFDFENDMTAVGDQNQNYIMHSQQIDRMNHENYILKLYIWTCMGSKCRENVKCDVENDITGVGHHHQNYFMHSRLKYRMQHDCQHPEANWKWQWVLPLGRPPRTTQSSRLVYSYAASTLHRHLGYRMTSKHPSLSNIRSCVGSPYNVWCLNWKKHDNCPSLLNPGKSSFCMLLLWILVQNTDENRDCLNFKRS